MAQWDTATTAAYANTSLPYSCRLENGVRIEGDGATLIYVLARDTRSAVPDVLRLGVDASTVCSTMPSVLRAVSLAELAAALPQLPPTMPLFYCTLRRDAHGRPRGPLVSGAAQTPLFGYAGLAQHRVPQCMSTELAELLGIVFAHGTAHVHVPDAVAAAAGAPPVVEIAVSFDGVRPGEVETASAGVDAAPPKAHRGHRGGTGRKRGAEKAHKKQRDSDKPPPRSPCARFARLAAALFPDDVRWLPATQPQSQSQVRTAVFSRAVAHVLAVEFACGWDGVEFVQHMASASASASGSVRGATFGHGRSYVRAHWTCIPAAVHAAAEYEKIVFLRAVARTWSVVANTADSDKDGDGDDDGYIHTLFRNESVALDMALLLRSFETAVVWLGPDRDSAEQGGADSDGTRLCLYGPMRHRIVWPTPEQISAPDADLPRRGRGAVERVLTPIEVFSPRPPAASARWEKAHSAMLRRGYPTWALRQALVAKGFTPAATPLAHKLRLERITGCVALPGPSHAAPVQAWTGHGIQAPAQAPAPAQHVFCGCSACVALYTVAAAIDAAHPGSVDTLAMAAHAAYVQRIDALA